MKIRVDDHDDSRLPYKLVFLDIDECLRESPLPPITSWSTKKDGIPALRVNLKNPPPSGTVRDVSSQLVSYELIPYEGNPGLNALIVFRGLSNTLSDWGVSASEHRESGRGSELALRVKTLVSPQNLSRPRTSDGAIVPDLKSTLSRSGDPTTRELMANARIGQGAFRTQVLANWDSRCCVTGSTTLDAIRASHIKPWCESNDYERLDPNNGLPLVATLDALFDAGLITFGNDGALMVSQRLNANERKLLGLNRLRLSRQPSEETSQYLEHHRAAIFV